MRENLNNLPTLVFEIVILPKEVLYYSNMRDIIVFNVFVCVERIRSFEPGRCNVHKTLLSGFI